jgi:hypothetical protein
MANPFHLKTVLLAKHAQHVVLTHFPIALFITSVAFDLVAQWTKRRGIADAAYYNLLVAAVSTVPVLATGLLACVSTVMIWRVGWMHFRVRRRAEALPNYRLAPEVLGVDLIA